MLGPASPAPLTRVSPARPHRQVSACCDARKPDGVAQKAQRTGVVEVAAPGA